jgi:predicted amidophosphoribosyltransferase
VGCFELAPQADVTDKRVLLIDDIVLSGATLQEAAKVLKRAGAKSVYGLVLAISPQHQEIVKRIRERIPDFGQ